MCKKLKIFSILIFLGRSLALAEQQDPFDLDFFDIDGYYRLRGLSTAGFPIDDTNEIDNNTALTNRLRLEPVLKLFDSLKIEVQADLLEGTLSQEVDGVTVPTGSPNGENLGGDFGEATWNRAWLDYRSPFGLIRAGRAPSHWGMGLLANSGDGFDDDFGDNQFATTVDRLLFATRPWALFNPDLKAFPLNLILAVDRVVEDPLAEIDDNAFNFIFSLLYQTEPTTGGIYIVRRIQDIEGIDPDTGLEKTDKPKLEAWALDGYLKLNRNLDEERSLFAEGELVYIFGNTDLGVDKLHTPPLEADIRQAGTAARAGYKTLWYQTAAEVGWASGDSDVLDNDVTAFSFSPDYNVGLILFEELLASLSEQSARHAADPLLRAVPPDGFTLIETDGAVTNAFYVNPTLKIWPAEGWEAIFGFLFAHAPQKLIDPYQTGINGGVPTNHFGGPADEDLGFEFDGGLSYTYTARSLDHLKLTGGVQGGYLLPGDAFNDADGNGLQNLWTVQGRLTIQW